MRDRRERREARTGVVPALVQAAAQQLHQLALGHRTVHQVQEGEQLRGLVDGLAGQHGEDPAQRGGRHRGEQRPGVEERGPAAQDGLVVVLPGVQPPAGGGAAVPRLHQADQQGLAPGLGRGADRHGQRPAGGAGVVGKQFAALVDLVQIAGPARDAHRVGQHPAGQRGQFGGDGEALGQRYATAAGGGAGGPAAGYAGLARLCAVDAGGRTG